MVFDAVKEDGVNMTELLQPVYISKHVFNFVILNAVSGTISLLIFNFYEKLLEE